MTFRVICLIVVGVASTFSLVLGLVNVAVADPPSLLRIQHDGRRPRLTALGYVGLGIVGYIWTFSVAIEDQLFILIATCLLFASINAQVWLQKGDPAKAE